MRIFFFAVVLVAPVAHALGDSWQTCRRVSDGYTYTVLNQDCAPGDRLLGISATRPVVDRDAHINQCAQLDYLINQRERYVNRSTSARVNDEQLRKLKETRWRMDCAAYRQ